MIVVLNSLARCTLPDIGASVGILRYFANKSTNFIVHVAKRVFGYLKDTCNYGLVITLSKNMNSLISYSNSNFAGDKNDQKSRSEWIGFWNIGLFFWTARKQVCVSLSTADAEYVTLSEGCSNIQGTINFLTKLNVPLGHSSVAAC